MQLAQPRPVVRPPALRRGGRIAVVSPSWGGPHMLPAAYGRALDVLEASGYRPSPMPHAAGRRNDWTAASARQRAEDINQAFADPGVDAVLCTIGGNHSAQVLPHLDFGTIGRNPKPFCGYSDITALHHGIHSATGLVTFYGPAVIPQWGVVGGPLPYSVDHFERVLGGTGAPGAVPRASEEVDDLDFGRSERLGEPLRRRPATARLALRPGRGQGPLLAGCLPSARTVLATPWQPDYAGRVLVLDLPTAPYSVADADADLTHLRLAGCLDRLAGLVVCRARGFSAGDEAALHDVVAEQTAGTRYPVVVRFEGGHSDPMPTWPIGVRAVIDGDDLAIVEPTVRDGVPQSGRS